MRDMRYQCTVCPDYDLCATCHDACHSANATVRAGYSAFNPSTHSWEHPCTAVPISPRGDDSAAAAPTAAAPTAVTATSSSNSDSTALPDDALQKLCAELYPLLVEQLPKVVSSSSSTAASLAGSSASSAAQQQVSAASSAQYLVLLVKLAVGGSSSAAAARVPALVRLLVAQLRAAATALLESTDSAPAQLTARRPQVEAAALLAQTLRHVLAWLMTAGSSSSSKSDKVSDAAAGAATTAAGDTAAGTATDTAAGSTASAGGSSAADAMDIDSTEDDALPVMNSNSSASDMPSLASVHSEVLAHVLGGYADSSSSSKKSAKRQYGKSAAAASTTAATEPPLEAVLCGLLGRVLEALNCDKSGVSATSASSSIAAAAVREAAQGGLLLRVSCDPNGEATGTPLPVMAGTMTQLLMGDANLARGLPAVVKVHISFLTSCSACCALAL
jgi:trimeric autotransporter adhesin